MLSIMSRNADGLPDISRPTSKPSTIPSCSWTCRRFPWPTFQETVAPPPANDVPFRADKFTGEKIRHVRPDVGHFAHEFMSDDHRHGNGLLRPGVPFVDVEVGAANTRAVHADQHVVDADLRHRHL